MNRPLRPFLSLVFALTLLLCLLLPALALAVVGEVFDVPNLAGNITYRVAEDGPAYTVEVLNCDISYSGDVVIPATVTNASGQAYRVTGILDSAFAGRTDLTGVTIPGSVQSIGLQAFYGCTGLKSVTLEEGVTGTGKQAFRGCTGLESVTLPNSLRSIETQAFDGCTSLTGVTIPASVQSIGDWAFHKCRSLQSVTIPASVQSMGLNVFWGCTGLTSVTLQAGVGSLGPGAFYGCTGLTSVTIPASVASMGAAAFFECAGLRSVTFLNATPPKFEENIVMGQAYPNQAFDDCAAGLVFYVPAGSEGAYRAALIKAGLANPVINPSSGSADYTHGLYPMLSGDGAAWPGSGTLNFTSAGPFSGFQWASVDGAVLPASAYTVTEGSTVLALRPEYLATLSAGTHKLTMQFSGGYSEASFTTGAALVGPPKTGEQAQPWAVLALGVVALAGAWICLSRRKVK